jgi:hypothetical protein
LRLVWFLASYFFSPLVAWFFAGPVCVDGERASRLLLSKRRKPSPVGLGFVLLRSPIASKKKLDSPDKKEEAGNQEVHVQRSSTGDSVSWQYPF